MAEEFKPTWSDQAINDTSVQLKSIPNWKGYAADAPRVLKLVKSKWEEYIKLVDKYTPDHVLRDEIIENAKDTPSNFYKFLIEKVVFRRESSSREGYHDTESIWRKMRPYGKFLYDYRFFTFDKAANPAEPRDTLREWIKWPF